MESEHNSGMYNMKKEVSERKKIALELFEFGYVDSIIAVRAELSIPEIKDLRKKWEERSE